MEHYRCTAWTNASQRKAPSFKPAMVLLALISGENIILETRSRNVLPCFASRSKPFFVTTDGLHNIMYFKEIMMSPVECIVHCRRNITNEARVKTPALNTRWTIDLLPRDSGPCSGFYSWTFKGWPPEGGRRQVKAFLRLPPGSNRSNVYDIPQ